MQQSFINKEREKKVDTDGGKNIQHNHFKNLEQ